MDHLEDSAASDERKIAVPYLGVYKYRREGYFPFKTAYFRGGGHSENSPNKRIASLFQELIFFAIIDEFSKAFHLPVDLNELIVEKLGARYVSLLPFEQAVLNQISEWGHIPLGSHEDFESVLEDACDILLGLSRDLEPSVHSRLWSNLVFSLIVFLESINEATILLCERVIDELALPSTHKFVQARMLQSGWCMSQIYEFQGFSACSGYVASLLPAPRFPTIENHSLCSKQRCLPRSERGRFFKPIHTPYCHGSCADVIVDERELQQRIDSGSIPILTIRLAGNRLLLRVTSSVRRKYIAISHVWSHGLGNKESNSLPECQIKKILECIRSVSPACALWIDTLCIPFPRISTSQSAAQYSESSESWSRKRDCRLRAVSKISEIFSGAEAVIALDRNLEDVKGWGIHSKRLALQSCDWMRRVWTLEEGARGFKNLWIKFHDEMFHITSLLSDPGLRFNGKSEAIERSGISCLVVRLLEEEINSSLPFEFGQLISKMGNRETNPLIPLAKNLHRRNTTYPGDEFLCLISLMNLDRSLIFGQLSMETFLSNLSKIPEDLPFCHGERLDVPGLRWAPKSFLNTASPPFLIGASGPHNGIKLVSESRAFLGFAIRKDCFFLQNVFTLRRTSDNEPREAYVVMDEINEEPRYTFRALLRNKGDYSQKRGQKIPPRPSKKANRQCSALQNPIVAYQSSCEVVYPAALVLCRDYSDSVDRPGTNPGIILSNITRITLSTSEGSETFTGNYEAHVECFAVSSIPPCALATAQPIRGIFNHSVTLVLT